MDKRQEEDQKRDLAGDIFEGFTRYGHNVER